MIMWMEGSQKKSISSRMTSDEIVSVRLQFQLVKYMESNQRKPISSRKTFDQTGPAEREGSDMAMAEPKPR